MSLIWEKKKLEEVCHKIFAGGDKPKDHFSNTKSNFFSIPVVSNGEKNNGISGYTNLPTVSQEAITVSARGTIGFTVHRKYPFVPIVRLIVLIPNQEHISCEYIYYYLKSIDIDRTGTSIPQLTVPMIKKYSIPTPPLPEQKQIVETLNKAFEKIDKAIANMERNIENAEELFKSKAKEIFNQNGSSYNQMTLGDIGKVSMCKRILKKETNTTGGIPFYKIGTFGKKANAYISKKTYEDYRKKYSFPKKGDVLISASGTIGRRVIYDGEPAYFQDSNIVWIDNNELKVLNNYLYHFYGICEWNPSKGATISRLYNDDLRRIRISFPNKEMQSKLVKQLVSLKQLSDSLYSDYIKKLNNLKELKKSILEKAFKGELTSAA